jgi:hypothetical protein
MAKVALFDVRLGSSATATDQSRTEQTHQVEDMIVPTAVARASTSLLTCPRCMSADSRLTLLTGFGAYRRCDRCDHSWFIARDIPAESHVVVEFRDALERAAS